MASAINKEIFPTITLCIDIRKVMGNVYLVILVDIDGKRLSCVHCTPNEYPMYGTICLHDPSFQTDRIDESIVYAHIVSD